MIPHYLLYGLELTPKTLSSIVRAAGDSKLDVAPGPGRFTLRESVAHVLDWEPRFRSRLELAVAASGSKIEEFDEDELPRLGHYSEADVEKSLEQFAVKRAETVTYAKS